MGANPALWADLLRDLDAGLRHAREAAEMREAFFARRGTDPLAAVAFGLALGKHLDDAYTATERALERLVTSIDGDRPQGRDWHRQLLLRCAGPVEGLRDAIIGEVTSSRLVALLSFRHAYRNSYAGYEAERAMPNVDLALAAVAAAAAEIEAFCRGFGIVAETAVPRFAPVSGGEGGGDRG